MELQHTGVLFYFDLRNRLGASLLRQPVLIVYQPAIQVIAVILALNSAVYYPRLSTYASLWIEHYDQSETVISLNYIALAVGVIKASQAGGPLMNFIYARMKLRHGDAAVLEFRVPSFLFPASSSCLWTCSSTDGVQRRSCTGWSWTWAQPPLCAPASYLAKACWLTC